MPHIPDGRPYEGHTHEPSEQATTLGLIPADWEPPTRSDFDHDDAISPWNAWWFQNGGYQSPMTSSTGVGKHIDLRDAVGYGQNKGCWETKTPGVYRMDCAIWTLDKGVSGSSDFAIAICQGFTGSLTVQVSHAKYTLNANGGGQPFAWDSYRSISITFGWIFNQSSSAGDEMWTVRGYVENVTGSPWWHADSQLIIHRLSDATE